MVGGRGRPLTDLTTGSSQSLFAGGVMTRKGSVKRIFAAESGHECKGTMMFTILLGRALAQIVS